MIKPWHSVDHPALLPSPLFFRQNVSFLDMVLNSASQTALSNPAQVISFPVL